ncbi:MAG: alpha/beta hydrolase [Acidimicrobiia bacterium]|nr:alpha/beta hydrolase [Acidimicrobiia bacterium]
MDAMLRATVFLAALSLLGQTSAPKPTPAIQNMPYGTHPKQKIDFYKAASDRPTPLVVFIHGGGWTGGTKSNVANLEKLLGAGISVASVEYRFIQEAMEMGIQPPVKAPLYDAGRAVQTLRAKAAELNFDKDRVAYMGGSAGACTSLWLALHDDLADPTSSDPIARESTKPMFIAVTGAQTSLDPLQTRGWIPNMAYAGHAFGFRAEGRTRPEEFQLVIENRDQVLHWVREYSPYEHASKGDPAIYLDYPNQKEPVENGIAQKDPTHSAILGLNMAWRLQQVGVEVHLNYPAKPAAQTSALDYVISRFGK